MEQNFTTVDVIRYIYNETDYLNSLEIENAIENNFTLKEDYEDLLQVKNKLSECKMRVRPSLTKKLLEEI